jgi:chromosomal replication initiator protein
MLNQSERRMTLEISAAPAQPFEDFPRTAAFPASALNPRYTFENFITGESNKVVVALSQALGKDRDQFCPATPLLIIGGFGLGKTHLLNAIGQQAQSQSPGLKMRYTTGEEFINELINATRGGRMPQFREFYRGLDLLLLDDVEILAGKNRTQEEFGYTLDSLLHYNRQIVLTATKPPALIPNLEEQLQLRLQSGVSAIIEPPDYELRLRIVQTSAKSQSPRLNAEVLELIAQKVTGNISSLEGALNSLVAYARHSATELGLEKAEQLLNDLAFTARH